MAKVRDYAVSINAVAAASIAVEMPAHATGDLLLFFFNKDTASGGPSTPSGWSTVSGFTNPLNSTGAGNYLFAKRATSSSESLGSVSYTSESAICIVIAVQGCYGSTVADAISNCATATADDSTLPLDGGTFTPSYNNSLILSLLGTDSGFGPTSLPGWVNIFGGDAGANSLSASYTFQRTAAAITHPGYWGALADDSRWAILAIRDDGNANAPAYLDLGTTPSYLLAPMVFATVPDKGTWELVTNDITSVAMTAGGTKTLTQLDAVVAADSGYNPFRAATRVVAASSTTAMNASQLRRTANDDLTAGLGVIFGTFRPQVPRDYLDMGKVTAGGTGLMIADASNNYRMWCIAAQLSATTDPSNRQNFAIEVATEDTDWAESTTNPDLAAIQDWYFCGSGYFGACAVEWSDLYLLNKCVLAGGSSSVPMDFDGIANAINNGAGNIPLAVKSGAAMTLWTPVQFGGGDACHVNVNLRTFQFPRKADGAKYLDFHVSNNKMGVEFYGLSGDTLTFTNSVFTSDSPYYWKFNASHNAGATIDFSGTTVVGATVTLQATSDLDGMAFINCPSFTQNGATLTGMEFTNTKVISASLDDMALISNSSFESGGTGHAIEVSGSADTITFTGNTFTGYASSSGSTGNEAIYVNIASGTVTINISGGGSTPSIKTAGATVVVNNSVTLTLTGLVTGSDIVVRTANTNTVILSVDANSGTTYDYSYSYVAGTYVNIFVAKAGYVPYTVWDYQLGATDTSLPISQVVDRAYA